MCAIVVAILVAACRHCTRAIAALALALAPVCALGLPLSIQPQTLDGGAWSVRSGSNYVGYVQVGNWPFAPTPILSWSFAGTAASDWSIVSGGSDCTQGQVLAPSEVCLIYFAFDPSVAGPRNASLQIFVAPYPPNDVFSVPLFGSGNGALPAATTGAPSLVTGTSATLNGVGNPGGVDSTGTFRFHRFDPPNNFCDMYTASTGNVALGNVDGNVPYSTLVTGLNPATTYYYCAWVENGTFGPAIGSTVFFDTPTTAPYVTTEAASNRTGMAATLNGSATPNGEDTTAWFRWDTADPGTCNDSFGTRAPGSGGADLGQAPQPFSQALAGLSPGVTYYYCAIATNVQGTTFGQVAAFTTPLPPLATTQAATSVSNTAAQVNGAGIPNGAATIGFFRYATVSPGTCNDTFGTRAPASGGTQLGEGTTSQGYAEALTGLAPNTTYFYCAIVSSSEGTAFGALMSFTTRDVPANATDAATSITSSGATLNGSVNPNGDATFGHFRYSLVSPGACNDTFGTRAPASAATDSSLGAGSAPVGYSRAITGLQPGTTYFFCAIANNTYGTTFGLPQSFTTLAITPSVTTGAATNLTGTTATLDGTANPGAAATTGWFRYALISPGTCNDTFGTRAPAAGGSTLAAGTSAQGYQQALTGLLPGTTYYYCAVASNSAGTGFGLVSSFTTPQAPSVLTQAATSVTNTTATLNGVANPRGATTLGWFRYATTSPGTCDDAFGSRWPTSGFSALGSGFAPQAFSQPASGLAPNTTYYFCAIVSSAEGMAFGAVLSFLTNDVPATTTAAATSITGSTATLNGSVNPKGNNTAAHFRYATANPGSCNDAFGARAPAAAGSDAALGAGSSPVPTSQSIAGLAPGTTYFYCAIAGSTSGTTFGSVLSFTTLAVAPTVTTGAATNLATTSATLAGAVNPNGDVTTGWFRFAATSPGACDDSFGTRTPASGGTALGSGTSSQGFTQGIVGLSPGTTYYYCAIASNGIGTSFGAVTSLTTLPLYSLAVTVAGSGTGSVDVSPPGTMHPALSQVTLTATPAPFSVFAGWTGDCTGTVACVLTMDGNKAVTANFNVATYVLTVDKQGTGTGTVTSSPSGIVCGATCGKSYAAHTLVTLVATASTGSATAGWTGCDTVSSDKRQCTVAMESAKTVSPTFTANIVYNVVLEGAQEVDPYIAITQASGGGTVTYDPVQHFARFNLTATGLTGGYSYSELRGPAARGAVGPSLFVVPVGSQYVAGLTPDLETALQAGELYIVVYSNGFGSHIGELRGQVDNLGAAPRVTLTVTSTGPGTVTGKVETYQTVIDCGSDCTESVPVGKPVVLTATPTGNASFTGWGGACSGTGDCTVTMDAAKTVSASFASVGANLFTFITANQATAVVGQDVTFTLVVGNTGPENAAGVKAWGVIPAGATFVSASVNCGQDTLGPNNIVQCLPNMIGVGQAAQYTFVLRPTAAGTLTVNTDLSSPTFDPVAANNQSSVSVTVNPATRLGNISTRMRVGTGNDVLIGGFIIGGSSNKKVAVVATGPSLTQYGITNALAHPTLSLVRQSDQAVIATNDGWQNAGNAAQLTAAGFAPSNLLESAILIDLAPGAYTAIVSGAGNGTGVGIVAVYEVDHPEAPLVNISTRGQVLTGNDVMIGGFIINGTTSKTLAIVATGPSLTQYGITNALANPTLTLVRSSDQSVVATNDDWQAAANAATLQSLGFAPSNPLESAILVTLPPGAYTAILSGAGGGTGVGVIGVYAVD